jgi:tRNA(Ile)-lysidine synthase
MGPDPAVAAVRRAVRVALAGIEIGQPLVVALSGGPDSLALAAAVAFVAVQDGRRAGAITVDHGLQPESADQAGRAAQLAFDLGLDPVHIANVEVQPGSGPEAAARFARYAAIDRVRGDALVLLGHTRDDQAETVLLGLGRGSGPRSIVGMRPADGAYLRPLLDIPRATTVAACSALGLPHWSDPHNADPRFRRARLRHEVLPLLEDVLGGGVSAALARTAELLRDDLDALDALAPAPDADELPVELLAAEPRAIRTRALRAWAAAAGVPGLSASHLHALDDLVVTWRGQRGVDLPGGFVAIRRSGRLHVHPRD